MGVTLAFEERILKFSLQSEICYDASAKETKGETVTDAKFSVFCAS